jgi:carboxyl-terminal processing protease
LLDLGINSEMKPFIKLLYLIAFAFYGCSEFLFKDDPIDTPQTNFDLLWREFDLHYSNFVRKGINWDSLRDVYRPQALASTSDRQLFDAIASMLYVLNDGHVSLTSPFKSLFSNDPQKAKRPLNFDLTIIKSKYLTEQNMAGGGRILYGKVHDQIGYVYISTFEDVDIGRIDDWINGIDIAIETLKDMKGIVVDIRNNGGGDAYNSASIAGRFADQKRLFAYGYSRNGPDHTDFSIPFEWFVKPEGALQFTKKIVILTNKNTASAAERFALAMKSLPYVSQVGDSTEGAFPHSIPRELPNGWAYRVTTGVVVNATYESFEGFGIPPDFLVRISEAQSQQRLDPILEKAVNILK